MQTHTITILKSILQSITGNLVRSLLWISILTACQPATRNDKQILLATESLMENHPDSALRLLKQIHHYDKMKTADVALYALLMVQANNKCDHELESDSLINIAIRYFDKGQDPARAGYAWLYKARYEQQNNNPEKRAAALLKASVWAMSSHNDYLQGLIFGEKNYMFREENRFDSALHYAQLAYQSFARIRNRYNMVIGLHEIGQNYFKKKDYKHAFIVFRKATIMAEQPLDTLLLSHSLRYQALSLYYMGQNEEALSLLHRSVSMSKDAYDAGKLMNIGMIFHDSGRDDSAMIYLTKALNSRGSLQNHRDCHKLLSDIAAHNGDYRKAYRHLQRQYEINDSIQNSTLSSSFALLEKKYRYERFQTDFQKLQIDNQRTRIISLLLLLAFAVIVIILLFMLNWNKRNKIAHQKELIVQEESLRKKEEEKNNLLKNQFDLQQIALQNINKHNETLSAQLNSNNQSLKRKEIERMISDKENEKTELYHQLIFNVDSLYNNISTRLATKYPELTFHDILICCLLLAGFDSATIASLLNIRFRSFNTCRKRLRKKLELSHETNLIEFLTKF